MKFISLEPFIPSGSDFESSKEFFQELGFAISWDAGDYIGFSRDDCKFILQRYDNEAFAQNLMMCIKVDDVAGFRANVIEKKLRERFGIRIGQISEQPYGKEVNLTDIAGVCWHFVEEPSS